MSGALAWPFPCAPFSDLPSMAMTPLSPSPATSEAASPANAAELQETLEKLELHTPELGHLGAPLSAAQNRDEGDNEQFGEVVPRVLSSRIGNALERRQEKLHRPAPS